MKITKIELDRSQRGWSCAVFANLATGHQFTDLSFATCFHSRFLVIGLIRAWLVMVVRGRRIERREAVIRKAKGWA